MLSHRFATIQAGIRHSTVLLFLVFAFLVTSAGCSSPSPAIQSTTKIPGTSALISTGAGYSIGVFRGETQVGALTLQALSTLPKVTFTSEGKTEEGPTLMSALALVGIADFSQITVFGFTPGRLATAEITLTRAEVNDKVILDFSNQGTCKLAGASIPAKNWIVDAKSVVIK